MKNCLVRFSVLLLAACTIAQPSVAGNKPAKDSGEAKLVDSGSFSIFQKGQRIATETFRVQQRPDYSITTSDLKLEDGSSQTSELQLYPNGDLRKYVWRAIGPQKVESVLEPGDQILMQHTRVGSQKPMDFPYVLPPSTIVLDDYFFVHRELLAWRYVASGCGKALTKCTLVKAQLGIIVPRQHAPGNVTMEYVGPEKILVRGSERQLNRFNLKNDDQEWQLWLDEHHKLVRIVIASENAEVVRD